MKTYQDLLKIGENERDAILSALEDHPAYREGYALRLRDTDLVWEEYQIDPPDPDPDLDGDEALEILMGGAE